MTLEDAQRLADVFIVADGGCPTCVKGMCRKANEVFTDFNWKLEQHVGKYPGIIRVSQTSK